MIGWLADSLYSGVIGMWQLILLIPHPSWHRLVEAFVTGLIIKLGYFVGHRASNAYVSVHKPKTGKGIAAATGVAEYLEN